MLFLVFYQILFSVSSYASHLTSSKSTIIHYQCVSTGCCVHVARIKISIDNQHVTKPMQRYDILPEQPKENTEKITNLMIFLDSEHLYQTKIAVESTTEVCAPIIVL